MIDNLLLLLKFSKVRQLTNQVSVAEQDAVSAKTDVARAVSGNLAKECKAGEVSVNAKKIWHNCIRK